MSVQAIIKRLSLIIDLVSGINKPTKKEILDFLQNEGLKVDDRTLARDFAKLRDEFGIYLDYSTPEYRYYIDKEKSINLGSTFQFFDIANTAELLTSSLKNSKETLSFIEFEHEGLQKGTKHLADLLRATKEKKIVTIQYKKFRNPDSTNYTILPYLLKQYQGRWYIVGQKESTKEWRAFSLDRIESIEVLTNHFSRDESKNIKDFFSNYVGVSFIDQEPEAVQLWVSHEQVGYFETLPLHISQIELSRNEKGVVYGYHLVPTYEFIQKILKEHFYVKVMKPEWLKEKVIKFLKKAVEFYK